MVVRELEGFYSYETRDGERGRELDGLGTWLNEIAERDRSGHHVSSRRYYRPEKEHVDLI